MVVIQNLIEAQQPKKKAMKAFKNISSNAPAIAPPVPRRKSSADETKQQTTLTAQADHKKIFCSALESLRPTPLNAAIKMAAGVKPSNKAMSGEPFGFCGSFELVSMNLFCHFVLQSAKPE
jgi:hypothetical protein